MLAAALAAAILVPAAEAELIKPRGVTPSVVRPTPAPSAPQGPSAAPARGPVAAPAPQANPAPSSTPAPTRTPAPISQTPTAGPRPTPGPGYGVDDLPFPTTRDCNLNCQQQWYSYFAKEGDPGLNDFLGQIARNVKALASDTDACGLTCQRGVYRQFEDVRAAKAKRGEKDPDVEGVLKGLEENMDQFAREETGWVKPFDGGPYGVSPADDGDLLEIPDLLEEFAGISGFENVVWILVDVFTGGGSTANCAQPKTDGDGNSYCPQ